MESRDTSLRRHSVQLTDTTIALQRLRSFTIPAEMSRTMVRTLSRARRSYFSLPTRSIASQANPKKEGDISSVFISLSGSPTTPLPNRFADLKRDIIRGNEDQLVQSWQRLLSRLITENETVARLGPKVIPQIDFEDLHQAPDAFLAEVKKRGVAVIRGVIPQNEARGYKEEIEAYVRANPWTKGRRKTPDPIGPIPSYPDSVEPFQATTLKFSSYTGPRHKFAPDHTPTCSRFTAS